GVGGNPLRLEAPPARRPPPPQPHRQPELTARQPGPAQVRRDRKPVRSRSDDGNVDGLAHELAPFILFLLIAYLLIGRDIRRQPIRRHIRPNGARSSAANQAVSSIPRSDAAQARGLSSPRRQ